MTEAIVVASSASESQSLSTGLPLGMPHPIGIPMVPWRDPHTVSPEELSGHIARLEQACLANPQSADLRTALGMAYAVNFDVYKSMDALEEATAIEPQHFWAQMKYA